VALVVGLWLFYTSVALNFFIGFYKPIFFAISFSEMGLMALLEFILLLPVTRFFRRTSLLLLIPMSMPLYIAYFAYIGLIGNKGKYVWKGRLVK
jgi:hypothetical protein